MRKAKYVKTVAVVMPTWLRDELIRVSDKMEISYGDLVRRCIERGFRGWDQQECAGPHDQKISLAVSNEMYYRLYDMQIKNSADTVRKSIVGGLKWYR